MGASSAVGPFPLLMTEPLGQLRPLATGYYSWPSGAAATALLWASPGSLTASGREQPLRRMPFRSSSPSSSSWEDGPPINSDVLIGGQVHRHVCAHRLPLSSSLDTYVGTTRAPSCSLWPLDLSDQGAGFLANAAWLPLSAGKWSLRHQLRLATYTRSLSVP